MSARSHTLRRGLLFAAALGALLARPAGAGEPPAAPAPPAAPVPAAAQVPPPLQPLRMLKALLKILSMDRALVMRGDTEMVLAVPWERGQEAQRDALLDVARGLEKEITFKQRPLRFVPIPLKASAPAAFREALLKDNASAILVPAGISHPGIEAIAQVAKEEKLHTLAMDASLVEDWLTVSVVPDEDKMKVVFNANCIRAAGGLFEVALLKVARIYHRAKEP
ncbi:MAG TPA: hypothetical protein VND93_26865 [Myxococcales bacterium]|nr:hypothetical protein [Myxococcales bacterium]